METLLRFQETCTGTTPQFAIDRYFHRKVSRIFDFLYRKVKKQIFNTQLPLCALTLNNNPLYKAEKHTFKYSLVTGIRVNTGIRVKFN